MKKMPDELKRFPGPDDEEDDQDEIGTTNGAGSE